MLQLFDFGEKHDRCVQIEVHKKNGDGDTKYKLEEVGSVNAIEYNT